VDFGAGDANRPPQSAAFDNVTVLSDEFYQEITAHPNPADLAAVRVLSAAPATLDLFMWLTVNVPLHIAGSSTNVEVLAAAATTDPSRTSLGNTLDYRPRTTECL